MLREFLWVLGVGSGEQGEQGKSGAILGAESLESEKGSLEGEVGENSGSGRELGED